MITDEVFSFLPSTAKVDDSPLKRIGWFMKRSDFPDNCEFVIKEGDRPFIIIRGEGVFSFESGRRSPARSSCNLGSAWRNVPFERWASLVEDIKSGKVVP